MRILATLAAAAALAACGTEPGNMSANETANGAETSDSGSNTIDAKPTGNAAAPTPATGGGGDGTTLTREYMVGRWTEMGDCSIDAAEFRADGNFVFPWGDVVPWQLDGNRLTVTGNPQAFTVEVVDRNRLRVDKGGGSVRTWTRC